MSSKHHLHPDVPSASEAEEIYARAAARGITREELIDAGTAFARRVARIYGDALGGLERARLSRWSNHIVPLMVWDGREMTDEVADAISDLQMLVQMPGRLSEKSLEDLCCLLEDHIAICRSVPQDLSSKAHTREVLGIATELRTSFALFRHGYWPSPLEAQLLHDALKRLAVKLPDLWS